MISERWRQEFQVAALVTHRGGRRSSAGRADQVMIR
jgi:hypothetical protein